MQYVHLDISYTGLTLIQLVLISRFIIYHKSQNISFQCMSTSKETLCQCELLQQNYPAKYCPEQPIECFLTGHLSNQSGTKPNLVAKILATKFGVFFVIHVMFSKYVQYESNDNVIKNYGAVIPHDWDTCFEKIRRATNRGSFLRKLTSKGGTNYFFKIWAPVSLSKCLTPLDV